MAKQNIALEFEKAEYYTLQEASDYLNLKYRIDNISVEKLFKNIIKYKVNIYFFAKGFSVVCDYDTGFANPTIKQKEEISNSLDDITSFLDLIISDGNGLLLRFYHDCIEKFRFTETIEFQQYDEDIFNGALIFDRLHDNPETLDFLQKYINKDYFKRVSSIYPFIGACSTDLNDLDNEIQEIKKKSSLKIVDYTNYKQDKLYFATGVFKISKDELIILDKDLTNLENNIINNSPIPESTLDMRLIPRKGVGKDKIMAYEQARIIAKALWNNDKEQRIKTTEMACMVYAELYNNGFVKQLPKDQHSLKDWIKEVAPPYAQTGGRPPKDQ